MSYGERGNKKIGNFLNIFHCRLLPYINDCNYIDSILESRLYDFCTLSDIYFDD